MQYKLSASYERMRGFYSLPKNTIEIVFIGTSHIFHGITPMTLWENYGITSYSLAQERQILECSYAYIKEVLKYQTPKVVVLDVYDLIRDVEKFGMGVLHKSIDYMKWSKNKLNIISEIIDDKDMYWYFNNYLEHDTSKYIETTYEDLYSNREFITGDLYSIFMLERFRRFQSRYKIVQREETKPYPQGEKGLIERKKIYLEKIIQELTRRDIEICCVNTPYVIEEDYGRRFEELETYLKAQNVHYVDFNRHYNDAGINFKTDFWDRGHLNYWGATKITKYLGEYILTKCNIKFEDKKGTDQYKVWNAYNFQYKEVNENIMHKLLMKNESIRKNEAISNEFCEDFNKYIQNGIDINIVYSKITQDSNSIDIHLIKLEDETYAMQINYNLKDRDYALISRALLSEKISNWSNKKGMEIIFKPDNSKRDFIIQTIDKNGEFVRKIIQLDGTNDVKIKILFEDFDKPDKNGNKFSYEKISLFEIGVSTQWRGREGSGSVIIKSVKLF